MIRRTEHSISKQVMAQPVILPDGKQPLSLGSGTITDLIGVGGMSNVYRIWNPQLEQYRAVKLMKPDLAKSAQQRFQTEIKITAALSHPNIIEIHSVGEWNGLSLIEMEYIDGETLSGIISKKGALPMKVCTAVGIVISRALAYAHGKEYTLFGTTYHGLIHRDLKTSNIMIAHDGRVKLMDFGIARPIETSLLTMDGEVIGTMQYLAPEQIEGKNVGVAADLFALGTVLYETITGRKAFPQKNLSKLMSAKTGNTFIPLRFFKLHIPKRLEKLVGQCMLLDPEKRPKSAADLLVELAAIHRLLTDEPPKQVISRFVQDKTCKRIVHSFRRQLPILAIVATIAIALLLGIGTGLVVARKNIFNKSVTPAVPETIPETTEEHTPEIDSTNVQGPVRQETNISAISEPSAVGKTPSQQLFTPLPPLSYLTALQRSTGIKDPVELMAREAGANNFDGVLRIYEELSPASASETDARLLRLRALFALGKTADVDRLLKQPINDGEFYQIKARHFLDKGYISEALTLLEKSSTLAARLIDATVFRRDYLYYRARCLGRLFEQSPTEENRKKALDGWFEVKNALRMHPRNSYFRKAVSEMQRIGCAALPTKG